MNKQFFTILFTALFASLPVAAINFPAWLGRKETRTEQASRLMKEAREAVVSRIKATPKALKEAATFCKENPVDAAKAAFVVGLLGTVAYAARNSYLKGEHKQPAHNTIATQTPVAQAPTVQPSTVQTPVVKAAAVKTSVVKRAVKSVKAKVAKKRNQRRAKRNNVKKANGRKINRRK